MATEKEETLEVVEKKEEEKEEEREEEGKKSLNVKKMATNFFRSRSRDRQTEDKRERGRRDRSTVHSEGDLISEGGSEANGAVANSERKTRSVAEEGNKKPSLLSQLKSSVISGSNQKVHSSTKEINEENDEENKEEQEEEKNNGLMANLRQFVPALNLHRKHVKKEDVETGETRGLIAPSGDAENKKDAEDSKEEVEDDSKSKANRNEENDRKRKFRVCLSLFALLLLLLLLVIGLCLALNTDNTPIYKKGEMLTAHTHCGPVQGIADGDGMYSFVGVRYAAPVGRFEYARPPSSLADCVAMEKAGLANDTVCPRKWPDLNDDNDHNEDCLTLDIHTSSISYDHLKSVIVYLPGDDTTHQQHKRLQPSSKLAKENDVVYVSVNYRSGILGFLSLNSLSKQTYPPASGNYGLSDLIAALKWINLNIHQFGGHPRKVTILARDSGATLGLALAAVNQARPLINRMWLTNGAGQIRPDDLKQANEANKAIVEKVGCNQAEDEAKCLKDLSVSELLSAVPFGRHGFDATDLPEMDADTVDTWLTVDKRMLVQSPMDFFVDNRYDNEMPIVFGATAQSEANVDLLDFMDWTDSDLFREHVEGKLSSFNESLANSALKMYNSSSKSNYGSFASMVSDVRTICPMLSSAQMVSNNFVADVYFYLALNNAGMADNVFDIDAIFGTQNSNDEDHFGSNMRRLFYTFVKSGQMPREVDLTQGIYLIDDEINTQRVSEYEKCRFWSHNGVGYQYGKRF